MFCFLNIILVMFQINQNSANYQATGNCHLIDNNLIIKFVLLVTTQLDELDTVFYGGNVSNYLAAINQRNYYEMFHRILYIHNCNYYSSGSMKSARLANQRRWKFRLESFSFINQLNLQNFFTQLKHISTKNLLYKTFISMAKLNHLKN